MISENNNNNEAMKIPQTTHFMSRYSLKTRKNDIISPPGPGDSGLAIPFDAAAMAHVYKIWTGADQAPWMMRGQQPQKNPTISQKRSGQGNALCRLNRDVSQALLSALTPEQEGQMIPFSGKTVNLKCGTKAAPQIRLVVVFWSPSYWAAVGQSILEEDSSENSMVNLIQRFMKKHKVDVILSIAYVLPRWVQKNDLEDEQPPRKNNSATSSMAFPSKFVTTAPASLAYGLWQLGLVSCMLCPDIIISTSGDVARMVGCTGGMEVSSVCTEKAKGIVGTLQNLRRDAADTLPTIHRDLTRLTGQAAASGKQNTCHLKHPRHHKKPGVHHLRCPHPYLLTRDLEPMKPNDALRQRDDQACFVSVMKNLAEIATAAATTTTNHSAPAITKTSFLSYRHHHQAEPKHKKPKPPKLFNI